MLVNYGFPIDYLFNEDTYNFYQLILHMILACKLDCSKDLL